MLAQSRVVPARPAPAQAIQQCHHRHTHLHRVSAGKRNFGEKLGAELLDVVTGGQAKCSWLAQPTLCLLQHLNSCSAAYHYHVERLTECCSQQILTKAYGLSRLCTALACMHVTLDMWAVVVLAGWNMFMYSCTAKQSSAASKGMITSPPLYHN
jgi:hypothetical protein